MSGKTLCSPRNEEKSQHTECFKSRESLFPAEAQHIDGFEGSLLPLGFWHAHESQRREINAS